MSYHSEEKKKADWKEHLLQAIVALVILVGMFWYGVSNASTVSKCIDGFSQTTANVIQDKH